MRQNSKFYNPIKRDRLRELFADGKSYTIEAMAIKIQQEVPPEYAVRVQIRYGISAHQAKDNTFAGVCLLVRELLDAMVTKEMAISIPGSDTTTSMYRIAPKGKKIVDYTPKSTAPIANRRQKATPTNLGHTPAMGITPGQLFEVIKNFAEVTTEWVVSYLRDKVNVEIIRAQILASRGRKDGNKKKVMELSDEKVFKWGADRLISQLINRGRIQKAVKLIPVRDASATIDETAVVSGTGTEDACSSAGDSKCVSTTTVSLLKEELNVTMDLSSFPPAEHSPSS